MHLRGLFSVRRTRRRSWTTATGHEIAPCFLLPFLHCNALSAFSPPLCGQIPLVFCELSFQGSDHLFWGPLPYFTQMHFFVCAGLARSLREKCNLISQFWTCWIDIFWNRCSLTHTMPNEQWLANWPNLKTFWSDLQIYQNILMIVHGNTCANLARTLRLACVLRDFLAWRHITKM